MDNCLMAITSDCLNILSENLQSINKYLLGLCLKE